MDAFVDSVVGFAKGLLVSALLFTLEFDLRASFDFVKASFEEVLLMARPSFPFVNGSNFYIQV